MTSREQNNCGKVKLCFLFLTLLWLVSEMRHLNVELQSLKGCTSQGLAFSFKIKNSLEKETQGKIMWKHENFIYGMSEELP